MERSTNLQTFFNVQLIPQHNRTVLTEQLPYMTCRVKRTFISLVGLHLAVQLNRVLALLQLLLDLRLAYPTTAYLTSIKHISKFV